MDLGIAQTAKLTADYAAVLFWKIIRQFSVTVMRCGFTMDALSSQNLSMRLCKIQIVPGFAQNVNFSIFPICSFNYLFIYLFFIFISIFFFDDQLNLENQNRFDPLTKEK